MEKKNKKMTVQLMARIGIMSALVFVTTKFIRIPIPIGVGGKTQVSVGNSMCVLGGLLFGGIPGGLAAGIGSALVDLMDPLWAPEFWITFINKFAMGFVAGTVATRVKERTIGKDILAAALGAGTYVVLYLSKSVLEQVFLGSASEAIVTILVTKGVASLINAVIAVVVSVLLYKVIAPALRRANLFRDYVK